MEFLNIIVPSSVFLELLHHVKVFKLVSTCSASTLKLLFDFLDLEGGFGRLSVSPVFLLRLEVHHSDYRKLLVETERSGYKVSGGEEARSFRVQDSGHGFCKSVAQRRGCGVALK